MRKAIIFLIRLGVSGGILYFIFTRSDLNFQEIVKTIRGIHRPSLYIAMVTYGGVFLLGSLRWKVLLQAHRITLTFPRVLRLNFMGFFFNNFLPSLTGGDVVKAYYVSKETSKRAEAVMTIIVDRVTGLSALLLLGTVAGLLNLGNPEMRGPVLAILFIFTIFLALILLSFNRKVLEKISLTGQNPKPSRIKEMLRKLYQAFYFYRSCPRVLAQAVFLSLILQTLMVIINYQIAIGLGVKGVSIVYFFLFIPIAASISAIPISIAGWGVGEAAYKKCFSYIGLEGGISVSISLTIRLVLLAWSLIGLPLYLLHRLPEQERIS